MDLTVRVFTLQESMTAHVELTLKGFTGLFDNDFTKEREIWYRGRLVSRITEKTADGNELNLWCEPNPDEQSEQFVLKLVKRFGTPEEKISLGIEQ